MWPADIFNCEKNDNKIFQWITPVPGDMHLFKSTAETLRYMLWDGGHQNLCKVCKNMKDIVQWRDIHNMLSALHESFVCEALNDIQEGNQQTDLSLGESIENKSSSSDLDEISRFSA